MQLKAGRSRSRRSRCSTRMVSTSSTDSSDEEEEEIVQLCDSVNSPYLRVQVTGRGTNNIESSAGKRRRRRRSQTNQTNSDSGFSSWVSRGSNNSECSFPLTASSSGFHQRQLLDAGAEDNSRNFGSETQSSPENYIRRTKSRPLESSQCKRRRWLRTADALKKSGLLDITIKTAELIRRNQQLQREIVELQNETNSFVMSVLNNPENRNILENVKSKTQLYEIMVPGSRQIMGVSSEGSNCVTEGKSVASSYLSANADEVPSHAFSNADKATSSATDNVERTPSSVSTNADRTPSEDESKGLTQFLFCRSSPESRKESEEETHLEQIKEKNC